MRKIMPSLMMLFTAILFTQIVHAKIWRVNNQSNYDNTTYFGENYGGTPAYPVFKEINEAVANANVKNGDTLYVEGSPLPYAAARISKKLVIIGSGYFLTENEKVSNNTYDTRIGNIRFDVGSEGSEIIAFNVVGVNSSSDRVIYVVVNDITIKRCRIEKSIGFSASGISKVTILQNFFVSGTDNALANACCSNFVGPKELIFNNNIVQKTLIWTGNHILECKNNVFDGPANQLNLEFNTDSFQNNLLRAAGITANINSGTNVNVEYNTVSNSGVFQGTPGLVVEPAMNNLFLESESTDGMYQLQSNVTGNVAGKDGAERGAYGGVTIANRYSLSGLAAIPVVYSVSTTGVSEAGSGLPVNVKARTIE